MPTSSGGILHMQTGAGAVQVLRKGEAAEEFRSFEARAVAGARLGDGRVAGIPPVMAGVWGCGGEPWRGFNQRGSLNG